jgi:hypothetical protein
MLIFSAKCTLKSGKELQAKLAIKRADHVEFIEKLINLFPCHSDAETSGHACQFVQFG